MKAYENGSVINGCAVRLFWRNIRRKKPDLSKEANADAKKLSSRKHVLDIDPEVQEELAAMGGLQNYRCVISLRFDRLISLFAANDYDISLRPLPGHDLTKNTVELSLKKKWRLKDVSKPSVAEVVKIKDSHASKV